MMTKVERIELALRRAEYTFRSADVAQAIALRTLADALMVEASAEVEGDGGIMSRLAREIIAIVEGAPAPEPNR